MSVLGELASALGRNDERPNVELAEKLAASGDMAAIAELVGALGGRTAIANDAIKTLYEIGERRPELIAGHADAFFSALRSKNNRMAWGAMTALATIASVAGDTLAQRLPEIVAAADAGSVIAKDKAVAILATLVRDGRAAATAPLLAMVESAAVNQLPSYAEAALGVVSGEDRTTLAVIIASRLPDVPQPAKRARLEKVLRKLAKG